MKKVAVILAGSGYLDGAEIREAVLTLLALEQVDASYSMFALNKEQHHVVNHLTGQEASGEVRNVLTESARIARGKVADLATLNVTEFDALVMPGGFGVAKNMSSFAFEGSAAQLDETVMDKVHAFYNAKKPIGAICIAPAVVALALGKHAPTVSIGNDAGTAAELEKLGVTHQVCATNDCVVDEAYKIVTTPAYMDDNASLMDVHAGISKLADAVIKLI